MVQWLITHKIAVKTKCFSEQCFNINEQPKPVGDVYRYSVEIAMEEGELPALILLANTLHAEQLRAGGEHAIIRGEKAKRE